MYKDLRKVLLMPILAWKHAKVGKKDTETEKQAVLASLRMQEHKSWLDKKDKHDRQIVNCKGRTSNVTLALCSCRKGWSTLKRAREIPSKKKIYIYFWKNKIKDDFSCYLWNKGFRSSTWKYKKKQRLNVIKLWPSFLLVSLVFILLIFQSCGRKANGFV